VAGTKRDRQREGRQARQAALAAARRRQAMRRRAVFVAAAVLVALVLAWFLTRGGDKKKTVTTSSSTTSAPPSTALSSAAGKPCLAVSDPLPPGAPQVPVKVGPPPTGLVKEDLKQGSGVTVSPSATVTVNYIGVACSTGKIFDSSYSRNQTATFPLGQVIKGWQNGIPGMKVGGQRLLGVPPDQGYGPSGQGTTIAPDETLWFVVQVTATKAP